MQGDLQDFREKYREFHGDLSHFGMNEALEIEKVWFCHETRWSGTELEFQYALTLGKTDSKLPKELEKILSD